MIVVFKEKCQGIELQEGKCLDAYTNHGRVKLRRISQAPQPTPAVGELLLWRDTDDDRTRLLYRDPDLGVRSVELT